MSAGRVDFEWLARRLADLTPRSRSMSRRQVGAFANEDVGETREALLASLVNFIELAGYNRTNWQETPNREHLPMLAWLPGIGARLVLAYTPDGNWLVEGPEGSERFVHLPAKGCYIALALSGGNRQDYPSATAVFKTALLAHRGTYFKVVLASLLANILALAASFYSMQVYDRVIPTQGISTLIVLTIGVALAAVIELVVKIARSSLLENAVKVMDVELSHKIFLRLLGVRMDQFPASVGTLSAQLRSYETIRSFASSATLFIAVDTPFALLFLAVILMLAGIQTAMVPVVFFILALVTGLMFRRRIVEHTKTVVDASNRKLGLLVETVESAETLKASGSGWQKLSHWDELTRQTVENDAVVRRYSERSTYIAAFIQQSSYIGLIAVGAWIVSTTTSLTMGGLIACSILSGRILAPVAALPGLIVQWAHARVALDSLEKVFALENDNHGIDRPLAPEILRGEFLADAVKYAYRGGAEILNIPSLKIKSGEKVAILGTVGAGKSTLLKLLAGLYRPAEGRILLDGLELQQISRTHLSERVGYLPQETRLFAGTLRANLTSGLSGIREEEILHACETSGLSMLIASHPKGLDLEIAEGGAGVSGGQKQLIALTRLLLSAPDIWLLDEPTAAMDEQTERRCIDAIKRSILPGQTLILVTHKPSLLGLINRLIVMTPKGIVIDGPRDLVLQRLSQPPQPAPGQVVAVPRAAEA